MAKLASIGLILTISCLLAFTLDVYARKQGPVAEEATFLGDVRQGRVQDGLTIHFYAHEFLPGHPNATVFEVAKASITNNSPTGFGSVRVADYPITQGPDINSLHAGRMQGLITSADMSTIGISLNLNAVFTVYDGNVISLSGRSQVLDDSRELMVIGGTGYFRNIHGYAIQTTYKTGDPNYVMYEYTCYTPDFSNDLPNIDDGIIKMHARE